MYLCFNDATEENHTHRWPEVGEFECPDGPVAILTNDPADPAALGVQGICADVNDLMELLKFRNRSISFRERNGFPADGPHKHLSDDLQYYLDDIKAKVAAMGTNGFGEQVPAWARNLDELIAGAS